MRGPRLFQLIALSLLEAASAFAQHPLGAQFQVNTYTSGDQRDGRLDRLPGGGFVVVWQNRFSQISGRRFAPDGVPIGQEFQINAPTTAGQYPLAIRADGDGEFTVVWNRQFTSPGGGGFTAYARRLAPNGQPLAGQFVVAEGGKYAGDIQFEAEPEGAFVILWSSYGDLLGRRYATDGQLQGEFSVSGTAANYRQEPSITLGADGSFVVAWQHSDRTVYPFETEIRAQRFAPEGLPNGNEIQVSTTKGGHRGEPSVGMDTSGGFVVVWEDTVSVGNDSSYQSIQGRRFGANGNPTGPQFQINGYTYSSQMAPRIVVGAAGGFMVAWDSLGSAGTDTSSSSVQTRRFAPDGVAAGPEVQVNDHIFGAQHARDLTIAAGIDFAIVWNSDSSPGDDDSSSSVQARRFRSPFFADGFETGNRGRWSRSAP